MQRRRLRLYMYIGGYAIVTLPRPKLPCLVLQSDCMRARRNTDVTTSAQNERRLDVYAIAELQKRNRLFPNEQLRRSPCAWAQRCTTFRCVGGLPAWSDHQDSRPAYFAVCDIMCCTNRILCQSVGVEVNSGFCSQCHQILGGISRHSFF
jgi:hypothetical protein